MTRLFQRQSLSQLWREKVTARFSPASRLVGIAITGQAIAYVLAIILARRLSIVGFEAYVVASAVFILGVTLAPLGSEKLTLRLWPGLAARGDWRRARGLVRFGGRRTLATSLLTAAAIGIWAGLAVDGETRAAIIVTCLSLPAGALVHYGVDLLTAAGRPFRALAIFRIAVPAVALTLFAAALALGLAPAGWIAVTAWGVGWIAALALMTTSLRARLDPRITAATLRIDPGWPREAQPFLIYRVAQSLLAQSGVIGLELLGAGGADVGAYAAAAATVTMAAVLATATNRAYGRDLGVLLDSGDRAAIAALHRRRLVWAAPSLAGFLVVTLVFPEVLLGLFRPEFASAGATPLRLLALTAAITVTFALAPTQLKFKRRNRSIYAVIAVAVSAQVALLALLVPYFGATGAALAYTVALGGSYATFAVLARRAVPPPETYW